MTGKFFLLAFLLLQSWLCAQAVPQNPAPVSFLSDTRHTGVFNEKPAASAPEVKYFFKTGGAVRSAPAVFMGRVFFGSSDGYFYCIDENTGSEVWKFKTDGSVASSPAIDRNKIYFSSRDGFLYCLDIKSGKALWKFSLGKDLFYRWEYDYYLSSPLVHNGILYIGSGDGNLYAVDAAKGKELWKFAAGSRIRSTPALADGVLYFGDFAGMLYAVDVKNHKAKWVFETDGAKIKIEDFGFDRSAIVSSASVTDNEIFAGSREGCLYCVDRESGKLKWKDDQKMSWVISTPAIYKDMVIAGTSDGHFVKSLNIKTGQEAWRYPTATPVWTSCAIAGSVVYAGDYDGNFFALSADDGSKLWDFKTDDKIHGSPVVHGGTVFFGSDDGFLYAIKGSEQTGSQMTKPRKAVYWEESKGYNYFANRTDEYIRDYFVRQGYELLDSEKLKQFMEESLKNNAAGVVVFARNEFPGNIYNDSAKTDLLRDFLKGNNRVVLLGENPLAYIKNKEGKLTELDYRRASGYFGIQYGGELTDAMKGLYPCSVTEQGIKTGLKGFWISMAAVTPDQVDIVYARDENGRAACWLKNYGGPAGSGLMQLWTGRQFPSPLGMIKNAVELAP